MYKCCTYTGINPSLIIGQEFDVLIMSTVESVYSDGRPFDPLKSLAHSAVFNTAITRARSLVIAIGNPDTLRRSEHSIEGSSRCWDLFISTCEQSRTYHSDGQMVSKEVTKVKIIYDSKYSMQKYCSIIM